MMPRLLEQWTRLNAYLVGLRELGLSGYDDWEGVFGWLVRQTGRIGAGVDVNGTNRVTKEERLRRLEELCRQVPDAAPHPS